MSGETLAIVVLLVSFFAMVFLRFPIAYAVALSSVFCLLSQGLPPEPIRQPMVIKNGTAMRLKELIPFTIC